MRGFKICFWLRETGVLSSIRRVVQKLFIRSSRLGDPRERERERETKQRASPRKAQSPAPFAEMEPSIFLLRVWLAFFASPLQRFISFREKRKRKAEGPLRRGCASQRNEKSRSRGGRPSLSTKSNAICTVKGKEDGY